MNYELICKVVLVAFAFGGAVSCVYRRPDWLLLQVVAGISLGGFNWYAGTLILPLKVTMAFGLIYLALLDHSWMKKISTSRNALFWAIGIALGISVVVAYATGSSEFFIESSGLQGALLRPLVQAYTYVSGLAIFPLALAAFDTERKLRSFYRGYIAVAVFSALVALFQLLLVSSGREFMPILRWNAEHSQIAAFGLGGVLVQRLYAFAGEPKFLAVFLMPAMFMLLASAVIAEGNRRRLWPRVAALCLIGATFILTFSSAGLIALPFGLLLLSRVVSGRVRSGLAGFISAAALLILTLEIAAALTGFGTSGGSASNSPGLGAAIHERSVGRITDQGNELYELQALQYLLDEGLGAWLVGLGPGMYVFHLAQTWDRGINPIDSGWVSLVVDLGLLGTMFFAYWIYGIWTRNSAINRNYPLNQKLQLLWLESIFFSGLTAALVANAGACVAGCPHALIMLFAGASVAVQRQLAQGAGPSSPPAHLPRLRRPRLPRSIARRSPKNPEEPSGVHQT